MKHVFTFRFARLAIAFGFLGWMRALQAAPVPVERVTDVLEVWSPANRVYFKGDVGMSSEALNRLDEWVLKNAPNWTIVLADAVGTERYRNAEGRELSGLSAVEYAMGQGLPNRTGHGDLKDSRTGERNGAVFTIVTKDRKITYSSSEQQDRRGLGNSAWQGNLDKPAINSLRNGMRIAEAVEKTINQIEGRVTASVEKAERERRESLARAEQTRRENIARAKAELNATQRELAELVRSLAKFRGAYPNAQGDLAGPSVVEFEAQLELLAGKAETAPQEAINGLKLVKAGIVGHLQKLREYPVAESQIENLRERIAAMQSSPFVSGVRERVKEMEASLLEMAAMHRLGDSRYAPRLAAVADDVATMERWFAYAEVAAKRRAAYRWALTISISVASLLVLMVLSLRRRGEKRTALRRLQAWRALLASKTDALLGLLSDARITIGSLADAEERFAGLSLEKAKAAIRKVDELFILSSHLRDIVDRAECLAYPKGPAVVLNLLTKLPYRRINALLTTSKIEFDPHAPLKKLITKEGETNALLGRVEDYQAFEIGVKSLVDVFNGKAVEARAGLDEIAAAWPAADALRAEIEASLLRLKAMDPELLPALRSTLLPELERRSEAGLQLCLRDALAGVPKLREVQAIAAQGEAAAGLAVENAEEATLVQSALASMEAGGIAANWIGEARVTLRSGANQALSVCLDQDVSATVQKLHAYREQWLKRLAEADLAAGRLRELEALLPTLEAAFPAEQEQLRNVLAAGGTSVAADGLLAEPEFGVLPKYKSARAQVAIARRVLGNGDVDAALAILHSAEELVASAGRIVAESLDVAQDFSAAKAALQETLGRLRREKSGAAAALAGMRSTYLPCAFAISADVASAAESNFTVADNVEEIGQFDEQATEALSKAEKSLAAGHPMNAGRALAAAEDSLELMENRIDEIGAKQRELDEIQAAVRKTLAILQEDEVKLRERMASFSTREANRRTVADLLPHIEAAPALLSAVPRDPFAIRGKLAELAAAVSRAKTDLKNDPDLLQFAETALITAAGHLDTARRLAATELHASAAPSAALLAAKDETERIGGQIGVLEKAIRTPHSDWATIQAEAAKLAERLASCSADIKGELAAADQAIDAVRRARAESARAAGWSGRHGIRIQGTPGAEKVAAAEAYMLSGQYGLAFSMAETAVHTAHVAITAAELLVRRKDREEREAEEARRRAWNAANRSSRSSGSGSRSSFSSRSRSSSSSFSSRSGSRSSSFSSRSGSSSSSF